MANWALSECVIVGDERDLKSLYETIRGLENLSEPRTDSDFGKKWLGCLVDALGEDWRKIYCRGYWTDAEYSEGRLDLFIESAWSAPTELFGLIRKKYPSLMVLYYCEEPGNGIYVTNDRESLFFPARCIVNLCVDGFEHLEEYFDSEKEAFEWVSEYAGRKIFTDKELESYDAELQEKNIDNYCYIERISVV